MYMSLLYIHGIVVRKIKIKGIGISQVFSMNFSFGNSKFMYLGENIENEHS